MEVSLELVGILIRWKSNEIAVVNLNSLVVALPSFSQIILKVAYIHEVFSADLIDNDVCLVDELFDRHHHIANMNTFSII